MIPIEDRGYAVNRLNGIVHKRYAEHAIGLPRTSYRGVMATVVDPQPCPECWPPMPEVASYFCDRCNRRHSEGTAVYVRHQEPEAPHDAQPGESIVESKMRQEDEAVAAMFRTPEPEPYFPPYPEDKA